MDICVNHEKTSPRKEIPWNIWKPGRGKGLASRKDGTALDGGKKARRIIKQSVQPEDLTQILESIGKPNPEQMQGRKQIVRNRLDEFKKPTKHYLERRL